MSVVLGTGFDGVAQPVDNPRLCFDKHAATATATASASGADPAWVTDGETWSIWEAGSAAESLTLAFGSAVAIDYVGIAAHNLGSTSASVQIRFQMTSGGSFDIPSDIGLHDPTDDGAILFLFEPRTVLGVRLVFSGGTASPQIAVAQAGEALELPRKAVYTALPIPESKQIRYRHQQSIRGDVLGRAVEGADLQFSVTINNLPETFREAAGDITWRGFVEHVESVGPFFVATKPDSYPDDVAYARCSEQPRFDRARANRTLSGDVTLQCMGYSAP